MNEHLGQKDMQNSEERVENVCISLEYSIWLLTGGGLCWHSANSYCS
jgi:hypothetical protein